MIDFEFSGCIPAIKSFNQTARCKLHNNQKLFKRFYYSERGNYFFAFPDSGTHKSLNFDIFEKFKTFFSHFSTSIFLWRRQKKAAAIL